MKQPLTYRSNFTSTNIGGYRYFFNGQEADNEVFGMVANFGYEFRQYDSRLGGWWSVDPKWSEYQSTSSYAYCRNNPIILYDPNGMSDDWVKNKETGEVEWRQEVHCAEQTPIGYDYIGHTYSLPDGSGCLGNVSYNKWNGDGYLIGDESAMVSIKIEFIPSNSSESYNWVQTYSTNFFTDSNGEFDFSRISDNYSNYVDCGYQSMDPTISCYFNSSLPTTVLEDGNRRFAGSGKEIGMYFTSSVVNTSNNTRLISLKWGYSISADGYASFSPLVISSDIDEFHKTAIQHAK